MDDPLEKTVAADDYDPKTKTSRNNCPAWMRLSIPITQTQRVIMQNGNRGWSRREKKAESE